MNIFPEVLLHYGQLLLALLVFFLTGRLIRWCLGITDKFFTELFFSVFIGMTAWIALYAIVKSGGRTINILWILPAAYFLYQYYPKQNTVRKPFFGFEITAHHLGAVLLGTLLCYGWEAYFFFWPGGPMKYHIPYGDNVYYARIITGLLQSGEESFLSLDNQLLKITGDLYPYHYYEFWLSAICSGFGFVPPVIALMLTASPLQYWVVLIGILAFFERTHPIRFYHVIIVFAAIFSYGIFIDTYKSIPFLQYAADLKSNLLDAIGKKTAPYYITVIGFLLISRNHQKYTDSIVWLLGLCIMTIVAVPAVTGGLLLIQLLRWIVLKNKKEFLQSSSLIILLSAGIVLVYWGYIKETVTTRASVGIASEPIVFSTALLITKIKFLAGLWLLIFILYAPWIFIIKSALVSIERLAILLSIMIVGSVFWALMSPGLDVFQFFTHISFAALNCMVVLFVSLLFFSHPDDKKLLYYAKAIVTSLLLIWCGMNQFYQQRFIYSFSKNYDSRYIHRVQSFISNMNNGLGASLSPPNHQFYGLALGEQLGDYLSVMRPFFYTITISTFDMHTSSKALMKDLAFMAFTQFVNRQKAEGTFRSIPQSQADFIRKHRMGYLIASKSAIVPPTIQPMITDSIVDSKSGERFYLLKP